MARGTRLDLPNDCRLTARCFKACFGFRIEPPYDFSDYQSQNSAIEEFFARRQGDPEGGEGGERIQKIHERPVFALHLGKTRGATWFDKSRPPEGIVWLLGVEKHDERHKGRSDAADIFAGQEAAGELYPLDVDYKLLELSRRVRDTMGFEEKAIIDADGLIRDALEKGSTEGAIAEVPTRMVATDGGDPVVVAVAVSTRPIIGRLSGLEIALTQERFLLIAAIVQRVAASIGGDAVAEEPVFDFPGGLGGGERAFLIALPRPS